MVQQSITSSPPVGLILPCLQLKPLQLVCYAQISHTLNSCLQALLGPTLVRKIPMVVEKLAISPHDAAEGNQTPSSRGAVGIGGGNSAERSADLGHDTLEAVSMSGFA